MGKGTEEGIACAGKARAVLSEMSCELPAVLAPGGPVPLLSACSAQGLIVLQQDVHQLDLQLRSCFLLEEKTRSASESV